MTDWWGRKNLTILHTQLGVRSVYDSVCYCNRCGLCAHVCPSYRQTPQEPFSPRGRNQAMRLIVEGKIKPGRAQKQLTEMLASCSLCGRCVQQCPGGVPTAEHMQELRRRLKISLLPDTLLGLLRLRQTFPRLFRALVKTGLALRKTGLMHLLALPEDFAWLRHALNILPKKIPVRGKIETPQDPTLIYLPSVEAELLLPELFTKTYQLAAQKYRPIVWENTPSGLAEYAYGDVRRARQLVRKLISRHAKLNRGKLPLLTDSLEVYYFLHRAPQLFEGYPSFQEKARLFADKVCFVTNLFSKHLPQTHHFASPVQLCFAGSFSGEKSPLQTAQQILYTLFKKNFVQCDYEDVSVAFAGYGFVKHTHAPAYMTQAVRAISAHQTRTVFVSSGLAELELAFYLRKFYPTVQACHIVQLNG